VASCRMCEKKTKITPPSPPHLRPPSHHPPPTTTTTARPSLGACVCNVALFLVSYFFFFIDAHWAEPMQSNNTEDGAHEARIVPAKSRHRGRPDGRTLWCMAAMSGQRLGSMPARHDTYHTFGPPRRVVLRPTVLFMASRRRGSGVLWPSRRRRFVVCMYDFMRWPCDGKQPPLPPPPPFSLPPTPFRTLPPPSSPPPATGC